MGSAVELGEEQVPAARGELESAELGEQELADRRDSLEVLEVAYLPLATGAGRAAAGG